MSPINLINMSLAAMAWVVVGVVVYACLWGG